MRDYKLCLKSKKFVEAQVSIIRLNNLFDKLNLLATVKGNSEEKDP